MNRFSVLTLISLAVVAGCSSSTVGSSGGAPQASTRSHSVQQVLLDGKPQASATGVTVTQGTTITHTIKRGEAIPDGTRIDVPAGVVVVVVVVSTGGKSTVTLQPGASLTFVSTSSGEVIAHNAGNATFSVVPGALDFFRVQSGDALTASVHGTIFSVEEQNGNVTFVCTRGVVDIVKKGYVQVGSDSYQTTLVDVISPARTSRITYHPTKTWYIAKFANASAAQAFYQRQLTDAQRRRDPHEMEAARMNLGRVQHPRLHAILDRIRRIPEFLGVRHMRERMQAALTPRRALTRRTVTRRVVVRQGTMQSHRRRQPRPRPRRLRTRRCRRPNC